MGILGDSTVFILDPNDLDSYIACEYASYNLKNSLIAVIVDGKPTNKNKSLLNRLVLFFQKQRILGINDVQILNEIPHEVKLVICCSSLGKVANALNSKIYIESLIVSGGYIDINEDDVRQSTPRCNKKQSPMLSRDMISTDRVFASDVSEISKIYLMGENVLCSKINNVSGDLWKTDKLANKLFQKYNRYNEQYKNKVNHLITSKYALSLWNWKLLYKLQVMLNVAYKSPNYQYINNKVYWNVKKCTGKTPYRGCFIVYI